ncbi:MAG: prolyl oligopeptidase family serine peptidase [Chloroflexota bacterium]
MSRYDWQISCLTRTICSLICGLVGTILVACQPTPEANVVGYLISQQMDSFANSRAQEPSELPRQEVSSGALIGRVMYNDKAATRVSVLVAERTGTPYSTQTNEHGYYTIMDIPPGQYVPVAVGGNQTHVFDETMATDIFGTPYLVTIEPNQVSFARTITLQERIPPPLPAPLATSVNLSRTAIYSATALFPPESAAEVEAWQFDYQETRTDSLRVYTPLHLSLDDKLPLVFYVFPNYVDLWEPVNVAMAAQGFIVVAISLNVAHGVDIDAHAADARVALTLAREGILSPHITGGKPMALGGSFSSAVMHRLLRDEGDQISAWTTVGGISNAFSGSADFYAGRLSILPEYEFLIPALGRPNLHPLDFMRYSPVYTASQLPPTLIIHTDSDTIIPIEQAYELEAAVRAAGVPLEVFYYTDVSHYLRIDENMPEAGENMFYTIVEFARRYAE